MFETEDMLPRFPPAPSTGVNEATIKPTVPEVSIIFGKPPNSNSNSNSNPNSNSNSKQSAPLSYAAWKKQNLPRVTFPPNLNDEPVTPTSANYVTKRSNVFPMRTVTIPVQSTDQPPRQLVPGSLNQRRSLDSPSQVNPASESVLTICASTQTDSRGEFAFCELFQNEFRQLMGAIRELQDEQHKMRQIVETILVQQQEQMGHAFCCDQATQCEPEAVNAATRSASLENLPAYNLDGGTLHQALPNVKIYSPHITDAQRSATPVSHSPTYRMNTPPTNLKQNVQNVPTLPKPATERSMVMNELALKYLPSDKLTELLQETQIATGATPNKRQIPLRETDNFNRAPVDISNASYKYLRKYRLLPDQNSNSPTQNQQRLQDSPIPCENGSSAAETESPHIDLEHIRRQPKFL